MKENETYYTIGIDVGSSGLKAILKRSDGVVIDGGVAIRRYDGNPDKNGYSEQNPEIWWKATVETVTEIMRKTKIEKENVVGIGFSGQMHGAVTLDKNDQIVRPAIIWNDERNPKELEALVKEAKTVVKETGNFPYMRGTGLRIHWMYNYERSNYNKTEHLLLPKDYVAFKMTGKYMSENSGFSGTLLFNPKIKEISKDMMALCKVKDNMIPELISPWQSRGKLTEEAAKELGLTTDCIVAGGLPDQPAAHLGNGYMDVNAQTGTSLVAFVKKGEGQFVSGEGIVYVLDANENPAYLLCSKSGGGVLDWYKSQRPDILEEYRNTVMEKPEVEAYDIMQKKAEKIPAGAEGLLFAPYLFGEISPHQNENVRGAFLGINGNHTPDHFLRAVYDSLAGYIFMDFKNMLTNKFGIEVDQVSSAGGFSNSSLMREILASATGWSVKVPKLGQHAGAYAGAMCADVAAGLKPNLNEALKDIEIAEETSPVKSLTPVYQQGYKVYEKAYFAINSISRRSVDFAKALKK